MKFRMFSLALFVLFVLAACQDGQSTAGGELPAEAPQFSISGDGGELDTSTQTLCWGDCESRGSGTALEPGSVDELAEDAPSFSADGEQQLSVGLDTDIAPTRYSYTSYERGEVYDSASIVTENIEEDAIEITGATPKTYIVRAEWYGEEENNLLGSIYTVFTIE